MKIYHERSRCPCQYCGKQHSDVKIIKEKCGAAFGYTSVDYMCSECAEKLRKGLYAGPKRDWAYIVNDLREWHNAIVTTPDLVNLSTLLETAAKAILELAGANVLKVKVSGVRVIKAEGIKE